MFRGDSVQALLLSSIMLMAMGPETRKAMTKSETKIEEMPAFYVVGLARRTNNAREASGVGEIGKVWQEFIQKRLANTIPHKVDDSLLAVYTDYGRYATLTSDKGPIPEVVIRLWQRVWSMSPIVLGGRRAFEADYEIYDQRAKDPRDGQVELRLGLE